MESDFQEIIPKIYLSGIYPIYDPTYIIQENINIVMSFLSNPRYKKIVKQTCAQNNIINYMFDAEDTLNHDMSFIFEETYHIICKHLNQNNKILIHCGAGVSRSATILVAFFLRYFKGQNKKTSVKKILKFIQTKREVQPNKNFMEQLKNYEIKLYGPII